MRKIHKITNIALICTLIGVLVCQSMAYGLRVPSIFSSERKGFVSSQGQEAELGVLKSKAKKIMLGFVTHKLANIIMQMSGEFYKLNKLLEKRQRKEMADSLDATAAELEDWLEDMREASRAPSPNLDIETALESVKSDVTSKADLIRRTFEELEALLGKDIFTKREERQVGKSIEKINEAITRFLNFLDVLFSLSESLDTNSINKIVLLCAEKLRKEKCRLTLPQEDLALESIIDEEPLIIIAVMDNFIMNAYRALEDKYSAVNIKVSREEEQVRIEFSDTGPGIPQENLPLIFQEGFTTKDSDEGGGQGLYLTLEYLKLRGGRIQVDTKTQTGKALKLTFDESLENTEISPSERTKRGTTFTVWLPLTQESPEGETLASNGGVEDLINLSTAERLMREAEIAMPQIPWHDRKDAEWERAMYGLRKSIRKIRRIEKTDIAILGEDPRVKLLLGRDLVLGAKEIEWMKEWTRDGTRELMFFQYIIGNIINKHRGLTHLLSIRLGLAFDGLGLVSKKLGLVLVTRQVRTTEKGSKYTVISVSDNRGRSMDIDGNPTSVRWFYKYYARGLEEGEVDDFSLATRFWAPFSIIHTAGESVIVEGKENLGDVKVGDPKIIWESPNDEAFGKTVRGCFPHEGADREDVIEDIIRRAKGDIELRAQQADVATPIGRRFRNILRSTCSFL